MLENSAAHADHVSEALESERNDLATMLEMTTEHADTVEDELHERATAALERSAKELRMILEATPAPVMIARSGRRRDRLCERDAGHAVPDQRAGTGRQEDRRPVLRGRRPAADDPRRWKPSARSITMSCVSSAWMARWSGSTSPCACSNSTTSPPSCRPCTTSLNARPPRSDCSSRWRRCGWNWRRPARTPRSPGARARPGSRTWMPR